MGLKVGCVYIPVVNSSVYGHVKPCDFTLKFAIAGSANGDVVIATCSLNARADISFSGPPLVDVLLNVVMGSVGNRLLVQALPVSRNKRWSLATRARNTVGAESLLLAIAEVDIG